MKLLGKKIHNMEPSIHNHSSIKVGKPIVTKEMREFAFKYAHWQEEYYNKFRNITLSHKFIEEQLCNGVLNPENVMDRFIEEVYNKKDSK